MWHSVVLAGQTQRKVPAATVSACVVGIRAAVSGTALGDVPDLDGTEPEFEWSPASSVAPRTRAPVTRDRVIDEHRVRESSLPTCGLWPSWAREKGPRPINARLETATTNGMFRSAFASARTR
ncbi:SOS response-associated peptidase family protein [Rhodococcus sp. IEGM 1408]|uniref:SOS response-associated peptidase family protein n=1 Tax=Rhodococcus sp. IEGM 1408 TaxID=3082220 RepID=UPI0039898437